MRYHEPHIGIAAVTVLEALGFEVELVKGRRCCGRPAFSQGNLKEAKRLGAHNLELLNSHQRPATDLFLEPSCYSMFVEDYRELRLPNAEAVAARSFLFEKFVDEMLEREPDALQFEPARRGGGDSRPLPREIVAQPEIHGAAGGATSRTKSDFARDRLLRDGRRLRANAGAKHELSLQGRSTAG